MTSEAKIRDRRNTILAAVIGTVLAGYASTAAALDFEFENGGSLNWNTTVSVGSSWRAEDPNKLLYTRADGSLIGLYSGVPLAPGQPVSKKDGQAGNQAAGDGNLNYAKGDAFSTPFRLLSDVEYKKGNFGALVRIKAWYDYALNENKVRVGSQANEFNGERGGLGPHAQTLCPPGTNGPTCMANSLPGKNAWPKAKLNDQGFEDEQKFDNIMLLDAYVYGSFNVGNTDLQLRLGNQVVNWGESVFIQGVNQINPIDVPAARRAGAELKEVLLPVWMAYANWGLPFGSLEAFYQLQYNNTSVDSCGSYWSVSGTLISSNPKACGSATVLGGIMGNPASGTLTPLVPQLGSQPWLQATGTYVPDTNHPQPSDSGQFGMAFRFPIDMIDTEIGLYAMNIHNRLPLFSTVTGTNPNDIPDPYKGILTGAGYIGNDAFGPYWKSPTSALRFRNLVPGLEKAIEGAMGGAIDLKPGKAFWEYPEDVQVFGISAATNLLGWSASAELSYSTDVPVQINGNDFTAGGTYGIGPEANRAKKIIQKSAGTIFQGWDRFDKTQFQVNTVKTFSNVIGADTLLIVGEVGAQWNNVPDYTKGGIRYGRGFMYGNGSGMDYGPGDGMAAQDHISLGTLVAGNLCSPTMVGVPFFTANALYNSSSLGCKNDGYVTDFAWGYRLRVSADYSNVFSSGVTVTPSVFWADDVEGVSMDPAFNEGRQTLGLGLKFSYQKKYTLDMNYVSYANENYDPLFDRDYYSAAVSVTF
jgi:hypothetical protein